MEIKQNHRGFDYTEFVDAYGEECSLQKSSLATEDCIWLGIDDPVVKVMASTLGKINPETGEMTGWIEVEQHPEALISGRMHLTRDMVRELLPVLKRFVKTGELE